MKKQTSLDKIMHARSVAVIGASNKAGSVGNLIMKRLKNGGFDGRVYPINPHEKEIEGCKVFKSVLDVHKPIELAIIAVPALSVLKVVEECNSAEIVNVIVVSNGFKESGIEGARLEKALTDRIAYYKMHMIGPNCMGIINTNENLNATFLHNNIAHGGKIGFVSQSGALATEIVDLLQNKNYGFSQVVSVGNQADLNLVDVIEYWENDDSVKIIMVYAENIPDMAKFKEVCGKVGLKKPIIILKAGRSEKGKIATASHTGALSDDETTLSTVLNACGVTREIYLRDFMNTIQAFNHCNLPKGNKLAILTNSGGPAVIATDAAGDFDVPLAELSEDTKTKLQAVVPPNSSLKNPVDIIATADFEQYSKCAKILLDSDEVDILLVIYLKLSDITEIDLIEKLNDLKQKYPNKSIVAIIQTSDAFFAELSKRPEVTVPVYSYAVDAIKAIKRLIERKDYLSKCGVFAKALPVRFEEVKKIIKSYKLKKESHVSTFKSLEILRNYGIPLAKYGLAKNLPQAKKLAKTVGYPLVLKVSSSKIVHKTEVGGVIVGIKDEQELKRKWELLMASLQTHNVIDDIEGVVVMRQILDTERQFVVGTIYGGEGIGNSLMFGLGGIFVETLKEVNFTNCPINLAGLERLISNTKAEKLMGSNRNYKAVDRQRLAEVLIRVSQLVEEHKEIAEIDINPIIADKEGRLIAIDARVVLK